MTSVHMHMHMHIHVHTPARRGAGACVCVYTLPLGAARVPHHRGRMPPRLSRVTAGRGALGEQALAARTAPYEAPQPRPARRCLAPRWQPTQQLTGPNSLHARAHPSQATLDDKLHFLFQCLDLDGSHAISRSELLVHLHVYATQALCAEDCAFSPEQLEQVISATFAAAELDGDGRIRRHSFTKLLGARPGLAAALRQRLSINVNRTIANLILGLDERWLAVGERPPRGSAASPHAGSRGASSSPHHRRAGVGHGVRSWCDGCSRDVTHWLRRTCCRDSPAHRRRAWDSCLRQIRARFRDKAEYVPTLTVIVP